MLVGKYDSMTTANLFPYCFGLHIVMAKGKGYCYGKGYCMVKEGQGSPKGSALSESKPDKFYQPQIKQDIMLIKQSLVILAISESANVKKIISNSILFWFSRRRL